MTDTAGVNADTDLTLHRLGDGHVHEPQWLPLGPQVAYLLQHHRFHGYPLGTAYASVCGVSREACDVGPLYLIDRSSRSHMMTALGPTIVPAPVSPKASSGGI